MAGNKRSLLVPEAREALDQMKELVTADVQQKPNGKSGPSPQSPVAKAAQSAGVPYKPDGDNGDLKARDAGKIGGQLGGPMVKRLVALAQQALEEEEKRP